MAESQRFTISGSELVNKVKELIRQGNVRRVRLIHEGKVLIDIPLTVGAPAAAVAVLAAPVLAAVAAIAAMVTQCTIEVEKVEDTDQIKS